jgi:hypothetical protein
MSDQNTVTPAQDITASELLSALEKQEKEALIGQKVIQHFGLSKFKPCPYNAEVIDKWLKANNREFEFESIVEAIETLTAQGELLPPAQRPPEPEPPPPFDYKGLDYQKLLRMSKVEYRKKYESPEFRPVIDRIILEEQARRPR